MKVFSGGSLLAVFLATVWSVGAAERERHYFNDLEAPGSVEDLLNIQTTLQSILPQTRAATVCLELGEEKGSGSGVIVSPEGLILTAAHVSGGVNRSIEAVMEDGTRYPVRTLGLLSNTDAAMAQIEGEGPFPYVEIDRAETTRLGDWVMSLGHSGGFDLERGVVVRLGRLVRMANHSWQTDGTLIGGDSGGPLFDLHGRLVGIHSRVGKVKLENLHVPMAEFVRNWETMLAEEFVGEGPFAQPLPGYLGVNLETNEESGEVSISEVLSGQAAEKGGLQAGDVFLQVDGQPVAGVESLKELLAGTIEGQAVALTVRRDGKEETIEVKVGGRE
ncbi:S1C family serine protease [Roseibacillus ishigakijimensis]|nr:S1C family serine protease [Roseibacillus ishigakijimensis]